ncbi:alpha-amylase family glycosyl hydrolase [Marivirga arenosa]|uniref:Alpha-amylase family glycosyl hydrolase n=1 Tax=Marivirga arenosa TaxID=3059076 RepID=A0AA51ZXN6_9BACT|nr:alpha-amylase family glycosyl hydrolase [Marivirga sp. BKB1-2]WNB18690.1 alpha-amylase family glycosyl hydrolase [Marivirga sp. BKB1-2]
MKNIYLFILIAIFTSCSTPESDTNAKTQESTAPFMWENATVYFLLADRFNNADSTNDMNFGRKQDGAPLRSFMGGDIKGISQKIKEGYFNDLGVNAIWVNPMVEQIHGAVDEGTGKSYGFHGYWTKDWTTLDPNFGTMNDLAELVKTAHEHDIRILLDVVMNHTGSVTDQDPLWKGWVRTGPNCTYQDWESTVKCTLVDNLPDILTESEEEVELPQHLLDKWEEEGRLDKELAELDEFFERTGYPRAPKYYLIKWITDYIREFGVDGFRVDTVKHTEAGIWGELYAEALKALRKWKEDNPEEKLDDLDFYMVGEIYNYSIYDGLEFTYDGDTAINFFDEGFHSMINFSLKWELKEKQPDEIFSKYSEILNQGELKNKSVLNYLSSHDDGSPYDAERKEVYNTANYLLLTPGASQIYYGDETARYLNAKADGDAKLRSFMNWGELGADSKREGYSIQDIHKHWQKLGTFRNNHPSVGAGIHQKISDNPYSFVRTLENENYDDAVYVVMEENIKDIEAPAIFKEGQEVRNHYTSEKSTVIDGRIKFKEDSRLLLLEGM